MFTNYLSIDFYSVFLKSELITFFKDLNIDTPHKLNIINSYKRTGGKTKMLRLNNYFFRDGKRIKYLSYFLQSYFSIFNKSKNYFIQNTSSLYNFT